MRRFSRKRLPETTAAKLEREQTAADSKLAAGKLSIVQEWKRARRNAPLNDAFKTLCRMSGERERCMYCGDSKGTDIEHFRPKALYPRGMFRWSNMLLGCTDCGRDHKGTAFPLDAAGDPLLLNPVSREDPWLHLYFDPLTGNFAPRYDSDKNPSPKGVATVDLLALDRREALASGHQKAWRRCSPTHWSRRSLQSRN